MNSRGAGSRSPCHVNMKGDHGHDPSKFCRKAHKILLSGANQIIFGCCRALSLTSSLQARRTRNIHAYPQYSRLGASHPQRLGNGRRFVAKNVTVAGLWYCADTPHISGQPPRGGLHTQDTPSVCVVVLGGGDTHVWFSIHDTHQSDKEGRWVGQKEKR